MPEPIPQKPITNPVLVDAMATFKLDLKNREHEKAFLQAAVEAKYLLPAQIRTTEDPQQDGQKRTAQISFQIMSNPQGNKFLPVFTDEIELRKNRKPGERFQVAALGFMDIYHFVKANEPISGVVINPFGSALCLVRQQVVAIGDNGGSIFISPNAEQQPAVSPQPVTGDQGEKNRETQQAVIRQAMADLEAAKAAESSEQSGETAASPITDELIAALKASLKKQKAVKKAYIKEEKEQNERFLLIALEAEESEIEKIAEALAEDCADSSNLPFDCVAASSIRAKELVSAEKPFYEKKRFGIF